MEIHVENNCISFVYINVQSDALKKLGIAAFDNIDIIYLIKYIIKFYTNIKNAIFL